MKKLQLLLIVSTIIATISCSKSSSSSNNNNNTACAECEGILANASVDASHKGVYKGFIIKNDGIGHFRLNYENGNAQTFMVLKYTRDGSYAVLKDSLMPTSITFINPGYTISLLGGGSKVDAYPVAPPNNPSIGNFTFSGGIGTGTKPDGDIFKETSTEEVKVYEGVVTMTGSSSPSGKVAFLIKGNLLKGMLSAGGYKDGMGLQTLGTDKKFSVHYSTYIGGLTYSGELVNDNQINGNLTNDAGTVYGTFTANRSF